MNRKGAFPSIGGDREETAKGRTREKHRDQEKVFVVGRQRSPGEETHARAAEYQLLQVVLQAFIGPSRGVKPRATNAANPVRECAG